MESAELDALWDFADPAESEKRFRETGTPEALTQVARALGLQKRFDEAHTVLGDLPADGIVGARTALERGRLFRDTGRKQEAVADFEDALHRAVTLKADYYAVDAAHMIAICRDDVQAHEIAIEMAAASSDERVRGWEASLLNNLGWTYFDSGSLSEALSCFQRALRARERQGKQTEIQIAKWCVARCQREMGNVGDALAEQYLLLESDTFGFAFEEVGECLLALGNEQAARPYFAEACNRLVDIDCVRRNRICELGNKSTFADLGHNRISLLRKTDTSSEEVWDLVATKSGIARWLGMTSAEITEGAVFELWIDGDENDAVKCEVLEISAPSRLRIQWDQTSLLSIDVADSELTLSHEGIEDLATYGAAWHSALDLIVHLLSGQEKKSFVENFGALLPEYERLISRAQNRETR